METPQIIPLVLLGALGVVAYKSLFAQAPDEKPDTTWHLNTPQVGCEYTRYLPTQDHLTGMERVGAQHIVGQFGAGKRLYFTPEVMRHLAAL